MNPRLLWDLVRFFLTAVVLMAVWWMFSTPTESLELVAGVLGSLLLSALTFRIFLADHEAGLRYFLPNPLWLPVLGIQLTVGLYASSLRMAFAVLTGRCRPRVVAFRTRLSSDLARFALANFITWTPGTITLDLNEDHLTVFWFFATTQHRKRAGEEIKADLEQTLGRVWV